MKKTSLLIILLCVCLLCGLLCACRAPSCSTLTMENPKLVLSEFVDAMRRRDFETAEGLVCNYASMGFEGAEDIGEYPYAELYNMLLDSYSVKFADESTDDVSVPYTSEDMYISGREAVMTFRFTAFSYDKASSELSRVISELGAEKMYHGETFDTEEEALALVNEAFETVFGDNAAEYYTERELTVSAWYTDDGWRLEISEDFYSALTGH